MLGEDPKAKEEFEELAKQEMEVWKSIMSGAAVMEHMEDRYHDMLKVGASAVLSSLSIGHRTALMYLPCLGLQRCSGFLCSPCEERLVHGCRGRGK